MLCSSGSQICTQIIEFEQRKIYNISIFLSLAVSKMREKSSAADLPPKTDARGYFLSSLSLDLTAWVRGFFIWQNALEVKQRCCQQSSRHWKLVIVSWCSSWGSQFRVLHSRTVHMVVSMHFFYEFFWTLLSCNLQFRWKGCCVSAQPRMVRSQLSLLWAPGSLYSAQYSPATSIENQPGTVVALPWKINRKNCFLLINSSLQKMKFVLHGTN